ncbi:MAG TPA: ribbon-helix-helix protein, CopG family [Chloroflexota bacterium]|nr:ribbon-helix-helix protein, CopG family [Chloroflexota bacterium]
MEVHISPDLKAKIDRWAAETGRSADEFVEEALEGYFDELDEVRRTLDNRYDDLASGRVRPIDGAEALARLREKSKAHRANW